MAFSKPVSAPRPKVDITREEPENPAVAVRKPKRGVVQRTRTPRNRFMPPSDRKSGR